MATRWRSTIGWQTYPRSRTRRTPINGTWGIDAMFLSFRRGEADEESVPTRYGFLASLGMTDRVARHLGRCVEMEEQGNGSRPRRQTAYQSWKAGEGIPEHGG